MRLAYDGLAAILPATGAMTDDQIAIVNKGDDMISILDPVSYGSEGSGGCIRNSEELRV